MTNEEVSVFLSKEWGRSVTLEEAEKINRDITALAHITIDSYFEFKKKGLIDNKGRLINRDSG
jgi:rRNA processing protein Krr1/Pno1